MGRLTSRVLPVLVAVGLLLGLAPAVVAAAPPTFGTPTAKSTFGTGVVFNQPVTVDQSVGRVELLLTTADAIGPTLIEVPLPPSSGSSTLSYTLDTSGNGHMLPNTPITAQWRLFDAADPTQSTLGPELHIVYDDDRFDWKTVMGDIVRVHYTEGTAAFGQRALKIGEDAIRDTSKLLGVTETKPIDFFIYADQNAFYDALGPSTRENVGGEAIAGIRTLFALIPPDQIDDPWVGIVIPHELTHLVFNTAAGNPYHFPPRWLNEGLAVYNSQGYDSGDRGLVGDGAKNGTLIPLDGLTGQFPTTGDRFGLAYAESVSSVDYLIRTYGSDALVKLIRSYADGRTDDEAFKAALGLDMTEFGGGWLADLHAKAPIKFGPQPAAPGPVPAAWSAGGAVPSPAAGAGGPLAAPTAAGSGAPNVASAPGEPASGDSVWWIAPVLALAAVVVVVGVLVAVRRRRTSEIDRG
jgi:hypothetical protein